jgi:hypothetical protein
VVFVGLRGSGEAAGEAQGYGAAVHAVARQVRGLVDEAGLTFADAPVDYPADGIVVADWAWAADLLGGDVPFLDGAQAGAERFAATVRSVRNRCGTGTSIAAVGFSQGAMAVHVGMRFLEGADRAAVASVDLLADPLRAAGQVGGRGDARDRLGGGGQNEQGLVWFAPEALGNEVLARAKEIDQGWRSWCAAGDPVCAAGVPGASSVAVLGALVSHWNVHSHAYQSDDAARTVAAAIAASLIPAGQRPEE